MKNTITTATVVLVIIATIMVAMVHAKSVTTFINNEGHVRRATIPMNVPVSTMVGDHKDVMTIDESKVVDARQLWSAPLQYAEYTTTMMSSRPATSGAYDSPVFATGDYLNDPVEANAMDVNGRVIFNFLGTSTEAEFVVSTARHINTYPAGDVDVAVAEHSSWARPPFTCTLFGFIARDGKSAKPVWTYTIPSCMASFEDNDWPSLAMSDDGSTVAFSFASNITDGRDYGVLSAQIHVLDAQSGKLLWSKDCRSIDKTVSPSVSISRHGEFIAFSNGNITYVINRDGTPRGTPFDKKISVPCHICPMGTFITWGAFDAHVSKWNATANAYQDRFVIPGRDKQGNEWFVESMATTINGGGSHPDGCLAAFGWTLTSDDARQSRVDIYNMFTAKLYWSWTSAHTTKVQTLPYLSFHMGYLAVAHWGNDDASDPQTLLFGLGSNKPLFTFTSPGSMFDVDVAVMGSPIPTFTDYETAPVPAPRAPNAVDQIWITSGGKHVHASVMGNGGDAYAFSVTVNATAAAAPHRAV